MATWLSFFSAQKVAASHIKTYFGGEWAWWATGVDEGWNRADGRKRGDKSTSVYSKGEGLSVRDLLFAFGNSRYYGRAWWKHFAMFWVPLCKNWLALNRDAYPEVSDQLDAPAPL